MCTCGDIVIDSFNRNRSVWNGVPLEITNKSCYSSVNLRRTWGIKKDEKIPPSNPDSWVWALQKTKQLSTPVSTRHVKKQRFWVYLLYIADQWVAVLVPVLLEWVLRRKLITAQLQSDLKTITAQIVEVLHTWQRERKKETSRVDNRQRVPFFFGDFLFVANMHNMAKSMRTPKHPTYISLLHI